MRFAGFALIVLSVALGAGGIAYESTADTSQVSQTPPDTKAQDAGGQCSVGQARKSYVPTHPVQVAGEGEKRVIVLNTRGYNYRRPGESMPTPVIPGEPPAAASPAP